MTRLREDADESQGPLPATARAPAAARAAAVAGAGNAGATLESLAVGDLAVLPPHGLAEVKAITAQTIEGAAGTFYELELRRRRLRVLIPAGKLVALGLRPVIGPREAAKVFAVLRRKPRRLTGPWPKLLRELVAKVGSGSIFDAAEVVRDLNRLKARAPLATTSQRLLDAAQALLVAELATATGRDEHEVEAEVLAVVGCRTRLPTGLRRE
jgi:CarD family transcriptional regulator